MLERAQTLINETLSPDVFQDAKSKKLGRAAGPVRRDTPTCCYPRLPLQKVKPNGQT